MAADSTPANAGSFGMRGVICRWPQHCGCPLAEIEGQRAFSTDTMRKRPCTEHGKLGPTARLGAQLKYTDNWCDLGKHARRNTGLAVIEE